ncbi:MAG: DUF4177 domain-containing protein [Niameybacter sp.]
MKKYEYKCISIWGGATKTTEILNEYGNNGWELVCVQNMWFYFKREK